MTEIKPGWYPIGDGLFEALWDGTTWVEGSKRPIPPSSTTTSSPATVKPAPAWATPWAAAALVSALGGVLAIVATFLPWMTATIGISTVNRNALQLGANEGFSWTGVVVLVAGLLVLVNGVASAFGVSLPWVFEHRSTFWSGVVLVAEPLLHLSPIGSWADKIRRDDSGAIAGVGFGLWVTVVAGAICVAAGLSQWYLDRQGRGQRPVMQHDQITATESRPEVTDDGSATTTDEPVQQGKDSFTWRAWLAALSPLSLIVWALVIALVYPSVSSSVAPWIVLALTWITCLGCVALAEQALGGGWVAVKVGVGPLWLAPLLAPLVYLRAVGPIRPRAPRWSVALAVLVVSVGLEVLIGTTWSTGNAHATTADQGANENAAVASSSSSLTCATIASHVIPQMNSNLAQSDPAGPRVASITDTKILVDGRQFPTSSAGQPITILKCSGVLVGTDGQTDQLVMSAYMNVGSNGLAEGGLQYDFGKP